MSVPMALLALLDDGPAHGFDLKRRYDALLGHGRELKYGQVYATLQRLERDGMAAGVGVDAGSGADRKLYAVTPQGDSELDTWLATAQPTSGGPAELFTRAVLALVSGRSATAVLDAHRKVFLDRTRQLTAARHDGDAIDRLAGDYEIAHLEADLQWIELAGARLKDLTATARSHTEPGSQAPSGQGETEGAQR